LEQVKRWNQYDKKMNENNNIDKHSKTNHKKSVKFGDSITLLEAAARCDYEEGAHKMFQ